MARQTWLEVQQLSIVYKAFALFTRCCGAKCSQSNQEHRGEPPSSALGSLTCVTQHTGATALRPIQRTNQRKSVLLKDTSVRLGLEPTLCSTETPKSVLLTARHTFEMKFSHCFNCISIWGYHKKGPNTPFKKRIASSRTNNIPKTKCTIWVRPCIIKDIYYKTKINLLSWQILTTGTVWLQALINFCGF